MYLIQCNLHLASCVKADRKDAFAERFVVTFCNSLLMVLHVAVVSVSFFHDFTTSSRFPSFSPMICVRTLFIPLLLSGMTNTTCLKFFVCLFFHKINVVTSRFSHST